MGVGGDETNPDDNHITVDDEMVMPVVTEELTDGPCMLAINWRNRTAGHHAVEWTGSRTINRPSVTVDCCDDIVFRTHGKEACPRSIKCDVVTTKKRLEPKRVRFSDELVQKTCGHRGKTML